MKLKKRQWETLDRSAIYRQPIGSTTNFVINRKSAGLTSATYQKENGGQEMTPEQFVDEAGKIHFRIPQILLNLLVTVKLALLQVVWKLARVVLRLTHWSFLWGLIYRLTDMDLQLRQTRANLLKEK